MSPRNSWPDLAAQIRQYALRRFGQVPLVLTFGFARGEVTIPVPEPAEAEQFAERPAGASWAGGPDPKHLPDWQQVYWPGLGVFRLTAKQGAVVAKLWEAWEEGSPAVSQEALLKACDSDCTRLRDLFSRSPAWGTLVVQGRPGEYRLAELPGGDDVNDETEA